jgi:hypothetical protein
MPNHLKMLDIDGATSLTFYCGELPADAAISAAGHEPNGYFWEGMVQYLSPELAELLELDSGPACWRPMLTDQCLIACGH